MAREHDYHSELLVRAIVGGREDAYEFRVQLQAALPVVPPAVPPVVPREFRLFRVSGRRGLRARSASPVQRWMRKARSMATQSVLENG